MRNQISTTQMTGGTLLPSEAVLSRVHQASRITVRKALEVLRGEGLVESRQGFGWLVSAHPLRQSVGRFTSIEAQMGELGVTPSRKILSVTVESAQARVKEILGDGELQVITRLNLADTLSFARVTIWIPVRLGLKFTVSELEERAFYQLLAERGSLEAPLARAVQTIAAIAIEPSDAKLLGVPKYSPALSCERITFDAAGTPVMFSVAIFPGHLTEFSTELTGEPASIAPSGLRLIN